MQPPSYEWPVATASYTYDEPGKYPVKLRLLSDYGEFEESGLIEVQTAEKPTAKFTISSESVQAGAEVSVEGGESETAKETKIDDYIWDFGDGFTDETEASKDTHIYTAAGTYKVELTVRDKDGQESQEATPHYVTVSEPTKTTNTTTSTTTSATTSSATKTTQASTASQTTTTTTSSAKTATVKKTETKAEKLAKALKKCKKDKSKKQRGSCEKQAKKKYGVSKKKKATKRPSKKSGRGMTKPTKDPRLLIIW